MPARRSFTATIVADPDGSTMTAIEVPFDPRAVFGKVRAPVRVTLKGYSYRSTIGAMGGPYFIPLRRSNREAAGVKAGQRVRVTLTLDEAPRTVATPADLRNALRNAGLLRTFEAMSYTHRREYVEAISGAKKPETRNRRIQGCLNTVRLRDRAARLPTPAHTRSSR